MDRRHRAPCGFLENLGGDQIARAQRTLSSAHPIDKPTPPPESPKRSLPAEPVQGASAVWSVDRKPEPLSAAGAVDNPVAEPTANRTSVVGWVMVAIPTLTFGLDASCRVSGLACGGDRISASPNACLRLPPAWVCSASWA